MLPVLLLSLANAGELLVLADGPVAVEVDGRLLANRPGERGGTASDLAGGAHRVRVFDGQDRLLASATVDVAVTDQVRLELRRGQLVELGRGPLPGAVAVCPAPAPEPVRPPPPPAPTKGPVAMVDADFGGFLAALKKEAFSTDKLTMIGNVSRNAWFTIDQVGRILDELPHSSDKVDAARILAPKVVDRQNAYELNEHLSFSSDKDTVQALFR